MEKIPPGVIAQIAFAERQTVVIHESPQVIKRGDGPVIAEIVPGAERKFVGQDKLRVFHADGKLDEYVLPDMPQQDIPQQSARPLLVMYNMSSKENE